MCRIRYAIIMMTSVQTLVIEPAILRAQSNLALVLATMSRRGRKRSAQPPPLQLLEAQEHLLWVKRRIHAKSLARVVKKAIACLAKHPGMPPWRRQMQKKPKKTRRFRLRQWKPRSSNTDLDRDAGSRSSGKRGLQLHK